MPIPPSRSVGQPGHVTDHNDITDTLTDHETRIATVEAADTLNTSEGDARYVQVGSTPLTLYGPDDTPPTDPPVGTLRIVRSGGGPTVPGQVTGLAATPGSTQVALTWTAPASNGGAGITDYRVQHRAPAGSGTWSTFADGVSTSTAATVTGLTNGTEYEFQVAAINSVGAGAYSSPVTATPSASATVPDAPTGLTASPGNGQVGLSWAAPANNGGAALTDYVVQYALAGSGTWNTFADGTSTSTAVTVTGLTNGTSYDFRVAAVNSVGQGAYSNTASGTPAASFLPSDLDNLAGWFKADALALSDGAAVATWTDSSGNARDLSQATASAQPVFKTGIVNAKPVVRFDGTGDYLPGFALPANDAQPWSLLLVAKLNGAVTANQTIVGMQNQSGSARSLFAQNSTQQWVFSAGSNIVHNQGLDTGWKVITVVANGASTVFRVNGVEVTGNAGAGELMRLAIGAAYAGAGFTNCDVAELVVYTDGVTPGEITSLETYAKSKYGLTF